MLFLPKTPSAPSSSSTAHVSMMKSSYLGQREHLSVERGPAQEEASKRRQKSRKNSSHRPISLTQIPEILNDSAADHVLGRHKGFGGCS
jgi:hypothetical protein